jgi:hypothetical protein
MRKDGLDFVDVRSSLQRGSVISVESHGSEWRWTVSGRNCDGEQIEIIVAVDEDAERIDVITVWKRE